MVTILHRELERKVEKVNKHMKFEVMRPRTKNNMNFQPEYTITDQSTLIVNFFVQNKDWWEVGGGGLLTFLLWKGGGLIREGGLIEDLRYVRAISKYKPPRGLILGGTI